MKTIMLQTDGLQCMCACEHTTVYRMLAGLVFVKKNGHRHSPFTPEAQPAANFICIHKFSQAILPVASSCQGSGILGMQVPRATLSAPSGKGEM